MLVEENPDNNRSPKSDHVKWVVKITGQNIRMIVGRLVVIFMWAYSPFGLGFTVRCGKWPFKTQVTFAII